MSRLSDDDANALAMLSQGGERFFAGRDHLRHRLERLGDEEERSTTLGRACRRNLSSCDDCKGEGSHAGAAWCDPCDGTGWRNVRAERAEAELAALKSALCHVAGGNIILTRRSVIAFGMAGADREHDGTPEGLAKALLEVAAEVDHG